MEQRQPEASARVFSIKTGQEATVEELASSAAVRFMQDFSERRMQLLRSTTLPLSDSVIVVDFVNREVLWRGSGN